jgi:hypothetical protein
MPSASLTYRLRIRTASGPGNPDGSSDALVVTSLRGGTNPFIAEPPRGDGLEVDPIRGGVRSGAYTVLVTDPITSGSSRLVTSQLADAGNRNQLLSRRAFIELSTDGGVNFTTVQAGYVLGLRLVDAITYEVTVGDTRRIEQQRTVFEFDDPTYFPVRGAVLGGPLIGGAFGPFPQRNGLFYRVTSSTATGNGGAIVNATFQSGYTTNGQLTTRWQDVVNPFGGTNTTRTDIDSWADAYFSLTSTVGGGGALGPFQYAFPGLIYRVYSFLLNTPLGNFLPLETRAGSIGGDVISMLWNPASAAPSVGTIIRVSLLTDRVSEDCPLYVSAHPVDVVRRLYQQADIPIDGASFDALRDLIGPQLRVSLRITQPNTLSKFVEDTLAGPFGIGLRVNAAGQVVAFSTRIKTDTLPTATVNTDSLIDEGVVFELDEGTVINRVKLTTQTLSLYDASRYPLVQGRPSVAPPRDGVLSSTETYEVENADVSVFGQRDISYTIPGMIHTADAFTSVGLSFATALAGEIFDRYGRGVQAADLACLRGAGLDTVTVGDEIYVQPAHLPNANKRFGDDPSVGARIMQVVRRTETPEGPELRVLDSGTAAQPATAATVSIAASAQFPQQVAEFTITNAATLNAAVINVAVQWATGPTTPTTDGEDFARYTSPNIPTGAVSLFPVTPGSTVWVRVRSEQPGRRPSAWSPWANVSLTAAPVPTSLNASDIKRNAVTLTWANTTTAYSIRVRVAPTAAASTSEAGWIVADFAPGTTRAVVRGLEGPSVAYTASASYVTPEGYPGGSVTTTFTTSNDADEALRPAGIAILSTDGPADDAGLPSGVAIAAWSADPAYQLVLERAPDVAGDPGTYAEIAVIPGTTEVYVDPLPLDGVVRWYRWRHRLSGYDDSDPTCGRFAAPGGVAPGVSRPPLIVPDVLVSIEETATTGTVRFDITDPQCRVVRVRARTRTDGVTWGAWVTLTAPYVVTDTIPVTGFLEVQYEVSGYDGAGALVTFASGIEYFDRGTSPDITLISGSFSITGQFFLNINADSDSASIKYATSTTGFPTLATVQAETAVAGRVINATLGGPFTSGAVVYVSALAYSGAGGTGQESPISQASFTRDTLDLRVDEELSETATVGTATIYVYDPTERVANFERRTKVGHAAWSAYSFATNVGSPTDKIYVQAVPLVEKVPSLIEYRLIGTTQNGVANQVLLSNVITFAMGEKPFIPDLFVTVREDGTVDAVVQGDSDTASTRVGFSTTSQAAADSAAAVATAVNGRTRTALNVGSLALGEKGFVSALAYSGAGGTGEVSEVAQAEIVRSNVAVGRTVRWNTAGVFQPQFPSTTSVARDLFGYIPMINLSGTATHYATLPVPTGATLQSVTIRIDLFLTFAGTGSVTMRLYRLENDGVSTQLGSDQVINTNGTQSLTVGSLSDSVTAARSYVVELEADSIDVSNLATAFYADVGYLSPNITVNL